MFITFTFMALLAFDRFTNLYHSLSVDVLKSHFSLPFFLSFFLTYVRRCNECSISIGLGNLFIRSGCVP